MINLKVGSKVTYKDINLRSYIGKIIEIKRTPRGGNCLVKWNDNVFESEEILDNLIEESK